LAAFYYGEELHYPSHHFDPPSINIVACKNHVTVFREPVPRCRTELRHPNDDTCTLPPLFGSMFHKRLPSSSGTHRCEMGDRDCPGPPSAKGRQDPGEKVSLFPFFLVFSSRMLCVSPKTPPLTS
jgi:hypothetical protein